MALEIAPTPILSGEDAERFLRQLEERDDRPALVPTPKLADVLQRIRARRDAPPPPLHGKPQSA